MKHRCFKKWLGALALFGMTGLGAHAARPGVASRSMEELMQAAGVASDADRTVVFKTKAIPAVPDPVLTWNTAALEAIKAESTPPPMASRHLAILHAAIYDAVNGITRTGAPYDAALAQAPAGAREEASASAAAYKVLVALYPKRSAAFSAVYGAAVPDTTAEPASASRQWGERVADAILSRRASDGSSASVAYTPTTVAGRWQPTPPNFAPALFPQWPSVTPFTMRSGSQFRPAAPPGITTPQFTAEYNEVKELGSANSVKRTADQAEIATFWADGAGTVTPPGHWNQIAQDVAVQRGNTMRQNARLFALLNFAMADAGIVAWDAKYAYDFWRPVTAIREADKAGNPDLVADPSWTPLLVTPPFSEYVSGHSTFSGAAAAALEGFFGTDSVSFTTGSRSFVRFSAAAEEAGMSRIYGGIHFNSANVKGLNAGKALGQYVTANYLMIGK